MELVALSKNKQENTEWAVNGTDEQYQAATNAHTVTASVRAAEHAL
jgi:hypothetical protein